MWKMQAKSSVSLMLVLWETSSSDFAGSFFPGPGSPIDIAGTDLGGGGGSISLPGAAGDIIYSDGAGGPLVDTGNFAVGVSAAHGFQFGEGCSLGSGGTWGVSGGIDSIVDGPVSFGIGDQCVTATTAEGSWARGIITNTTRWAQDSFCSDSDGAGAAEDFHRTTLYGNPSAAPLNLVDGAAFELTLDNSKTFQLTVEIMGQLQGSPGTTATEEHKIRASTSGGILSIQNDIQLLPPADAFPSQGWSVSINVSGSDKVLHVTVDPAGDSIIVIAVVRWSALPNI
jgi:hypothetical protein